MQSSDAATASLQHATPLPEEFVAEQPVEKVSTALLISQHQEALAACIGLAVQLSLSTLGLKAHAKRAARTSMPASSDHAEIFEAAHCKH